MDINLLVSYDASGGYFAGKNEIHSILVKLGDQKADMELLAPGIIGVKTKLVARKVVEEVRELFLGNPDSVKFALKWVPADFWCDFSLDKIRDVIKEEVKDLVLADDLVFVDVVKHKGDSDVGKVVDVVKSWLRCKFVSERAQKIVKVDIFDRVCVSLLRPVDIFSVER